MRALVVCNGGGIGDVFLATPVMRALRQRYAHVTALTKRGHQSVIGPHVADEVWTDTGNLLDLVHRLRAGNFDAAESAFHSVLEIAPNDGPSLFYLGQFEELREEALLGKWKGEIALKDK